MVAWECTRNCDRESHVIPFCVACLLCFSQNLPQYNLSLLQPNDRQIGRTKRTKEHSLSIIFYPIMADRRHIRNDSMCMRFTIDSTLFSTIFNWMLRFIHDWNDPFFVKQRIVIKQIFHLELMKLNPLCRCDMTADFFIVWAKNSYKCNNKSRKKTMRFNLMNRVTAIVQHVKNG